MCGPLLAARTVGGTQHVRFNVLVFDRAKAAIVSCNCVIRDLWKHLRGLAKEQPGRHLLENDAVVVWQQFSHSCMEMVVKYETKTM